MTNTNNQFIKQEAEKHNLLKRLSAIHTLKCNKSISFELALKSFNELSEFKILVLKSPDNELFDISSKIDVWQSTNPSVSEHEIIELLKFS